MCDPNCGGKCPYNKWAPLTPEGAAVWQAISETGGCLVYVEGHIVGIDARAILTRPSVADFDPEVIEYLVGKVEVGALIGIRNREKKHD